MEIAYSLWFWLGLVAVVGIIAGVITNAVNKSAETRKYVADAEAGGHHKKLAEDAATLNSTVIARLDAVDSRLAAIEKLLTDIP
jgi:ABC-type protease/lipase transport system fused ATPase/permease subunit